MTFEHLKTDPDYLPISIPFCNSDLQLFIAVVNQGIDSHLEGFVESVFADDSERAWLFFHVDELSILLRRLGEVDDEMQESADSWLSDIVQLQYGEEED